MDNNLLHLAYLHHIGFTHKDLKHLFETWEMYVEFFEKLLKNEWTCFGYLKKGGEKS